MPFRIENQLEVSLKLGDADLSNHYENVLSVNVIEQAGTELPMASMAVRTTNKKVPRMINEGNPLSVAIGDKDDGLSADFLLQRPTLSRSGSDEWMITANGIKDTFPGWAKPHVEISPEISGVERILEVARRAEGRTHANTEASRDRQRWVQYGNPDKMHVDDIWMHCDLGNSFPLLACSLDGFVLMDAAKLAEQDAKHKFGNTGAEGYSPYGWSEGAEHLGGFLASIGARGQTQPMHDMETGSASMLESTPSLLLSQGRPPFVDDFGKVANPRRALTRNMHPKYWESMIHNYTQIALQSSLRLSLYWTNKHIGIRPLDLVEVRETEIEDEDESAEAVSGKYLVSKVARKVQGNTIKTTCQLVRECFNFSDLGGRR